MSAPPSPRKQERARRSHPPSLRRLVERSVRDDKLFARGDLVLVACSGGPDSVALLHVLAMLRRDLGHEVAAHGVDHGLRADAAAELSLVSSLCEKLGVPFEVTRVKLAEGGNLQARAREARHVALQDAALRLDAQVIALGHTADDRAETLLLRLLRGSGPKGLGVLPSRSPAPFPPTVGDSGTLLARDLIRPMIHARRSDVMAHLDRHALPCAQDPSNLDPRFSRVRVRREVLPLLEDISPRVVEHLCALADMLLEAPPQASPLDSLSRAQRDLVESARKRGRRIVKIRVKSGEDVAVTFSEGEIVLNDKP